MNLAYISECISWVISFMQLLFIVLQTGILIPSFAVSGSAGSPLRNSHRADKPQAPSWLLVMSNMARTCRQLHVHKPLIYSIGAIIPFVTKTQIVFCWSSATWNSAKATGNALNTFDVFILSDSYNSISAS